MRILEISVAWFVLSLLLASTGAVDANENSLDRNWPTVSDKTELERTWRQSLVYLPRGFGKQSVKLLAVPGKFEKIIQAREGRAKLPTILFLHSCEGFGEHREDMRRLAKLGFVVIGPHSFARNFRPLGCYEDRSKFLPSFDLAIAFQKAELEFAVEKMTAFSWIDRNNLFLFGSGMGGAVVAQYGGAEFTGHLIEGWGCKGPKPDLDGIRAPQETRIFTTISRNDPFFLNNAGYDNDCAGFTKSRSGSMSVMLERPAHFVSWYPGSYEALIRFLMRDIAMDIEELVLDNPKVVESSPEYITLQQKWSDEAVYAGAVKHCATTSRQSHLVAEPVDEVYKFVCE